MGETRGRGKPRNVNGGLKGVDSGGDWRGSGEGGVGVSSGEKEEQL